MIITGFVISVLELMLFTYIYLYMLLLKNIIQKHSIKFIAMLIILKLLTIMKNSCYY